MSSRRVQVVILCEDQQQEVFARHFFMEKGFSRHSIRSRICAKGKQSAEQYVRDQYPIEVQAYRRKAMYMGLALSVSIDADRRQVIERKQQMDKALIDNGLEARKVSEKIVVWVPKRNIETWIHFLMDNDVDENSEYVKLDKPGLCIPLLRKLVSMYPAGLPGTAPPSLHDAFLEMKRMD
jgi:hypothetical protein